MITINNYSLKFWQKYSHLVIFDKDGTLVNDHGYVYKISDFEWQPRGLKLLLIASQKKAAICVVTNQSGIEKNFFTKKESVAFAKHLIRQARKFEIDIKKIIICPHAENFSLRGCICRKPKTGIYEKIKRYKWAHDLDTIMVGNSTADREFAGNCNIHYVDVNDENAPIILTTYLNPK